MEMLFDSPKPPVTITPLPDGKRDITVLANETEITEEPEREEPARTLYQYDGNRFRTVYGLTEEDILSDMEKYLSYDPKDEPTMEQLKHDNDLIDSYTMELLEGGVL